MKGWILTVDIGAVPNLTKGGEGFAFRKYENAGIFSSLQEIKNTQEGWTISEGNAKGNPLALLNSENQPYKSFVLTNFNKRPRIPIWLLIHCEFLENLWPYTEPDMNNESGRDCSGDSKRMLRTATSFILGQGETWGIYCRNTEVRDLYKIR